MISSGSCSCFWIQITKVHSSCCGSTTLCGKTWKLQRRFLHLFFQRWNMRRFVAFSTASFNWWRRLCSIWILMVSCVLFLAKTDSSLRVLLTWKSNNLSIWRLRLVSLIEKMGLLERTTHFFHRQRWSLLTVTIVERIRVRMTISQNVSFATFINLNTTYQLRLTWIICIIKLRYRTLWLDPFLLL